MPAAVFCIYCGTPVRETALGEPPLASEIGKQSLEPGKGYGIASLVLAMIGWTATLTYQFLVESDPAMDLFGAQSVGGLWFLVNVCLFLVVLSCAFTSTVYGIMGRNTKGWRYAYTGLVLSALLSLPVFLLIIAYIVLAEY